MRLGSLQLLDMTLQKIRVCAFGFAVIAALSFTSAELEGESLGEADVFDAATFRLLVQQREIQRAAAKPLDGSLTPRLAIQNPAAERHGEIAVLDTSDGVLRQDLPFDLNGLTVRFRPTEGSNGYTVDVESSVFRSELGKRVGLGDDDSQRIQLGFTFPFFGQSFNEIWLNSDGNLTFDGPDVEPDERNVERVLTGGPRICPLYADLDPSSSGAAVYAYLADDRLVVTWSSVPPYTEDGDGDPQTFQVALFADGIIEFSYEDVDLSSAIVGLGSGDQTGFVEAADFSAASQVMFNISVLEIFQEASIDLQALSHSFYRGFEDAYDFLVIFHDFDPGIESDAFAFYLPVRNSVLGIGFWPPPLESRNLTDIGFLLGSPRRLQGLIFMGLLDKYSDDPFERIDSRFGLGLNTPLTILAHEAGHRFLARTLFIDRERNAFSQELLGRQRAHWSYFMNSEASFLEGNRIVDHGSGEFRFETVETVAGFSSLDLYLMGLAPPEDVNDTFFVRNPDIGDALFSRAHEPLSGVFFNGERVDISIGDIIQAHGRRVPDTTVAQQHFRYAFLLLHESGRSPSAESLAKMERFRTAFDDFFDEMTGYRGDAETGLKQELNFSSWPAVGMLRGGSVNISVSRATASDVPVAVNLKSDTGAVALPEQIAIPAGRSSVRIPVEAAEAGVARIEGLAGDDFEIARSAIRVHESTAPFRAARIFLLEILFGVPIERFRTGEVGQPLPYPIFIQVVDDGFLAVGNVEVHFEASGDGRVSAPIALTNQSGLVAVEWDLASSPGPNQLRVSIPGSLQPAVVIDAIGSRVPLRQRY